MRANVPANIKFCFPPMHGFGAMHSKLQLLKYPSHLRVVIPTGNLMPYDWGETGVMENVSISRSRQLYTFFPVLFFGFFLLSPEKLTRGNLVFDFCI
jgi:hypothetical protein